MTLYLPQVGTPLEELDTPSLILDLDAFERNLQRLNDSLAGRRHLRLDFLLGRFFSEAFREANHCSCRFD